MEYVIKKGEIVSFLASCGTRTLRVVDGSIWLTRGDSRDYLLCEGRFLTVHSLENVVVEAMEDATFALMESAPTSADSVIQFHIPFPQNLDF